MNKYYGKYALKVLDYNTLGIYKQLTRKYWELVDTWEGRMEWEDFMDYITPEELHPERCMLSSGLRIS